jgi:hypothetical protein
MSFENKVTVTLLMFMVLGWAFAFPLNPERMQRYGLRTCYTAMTGLFIWTLWRIWS